MIGEVGGKDDFFHPPLGSLMSSIEHAMLTKFLKHKFHPLSIHPGRNEHSNTIVVPQQTLGLAYLTQRKTTHSISQNKTCSRKVYHIINLSNNSI